MAKESYAQVHRFGGKVACYVGTGETSYLSVKDAEKLAAALRKCAQDIKKQPNFAASEFRSFSLHFIDTME